MLARFTRFPYTTLFRSRLRLREIGRHRAVVHVVLQVVERTAQAHRHRDTRELVGRGTALPLGGRDYRRLGDVVERDRKSTRLNSSHLGISYAVFCLKKK